MAGAQSVPTTTVCQHVGSRRCVCDWYDVTKLAALYLTVWPLVSALPPLVTSAEIDELRCLLAEVATGARFVLQGGDCAERFIDCNASRIESKMQVLIQSGLIIGWGAQVPMLRIGRIAGQYAKPRSRDCETINGGTSKVSNF